MAKFFIERPIFAWVIAIFIMVDGFQKLPRGKPGDPIVVKPVPWQPLGAAKAPAAAAPASAAAPAASAASAAKQ